MDGMQTIEPKLSFSDCLKRAEAAASCTVWLKMDKGRSFRGDPVIIAKQFADLVDDVREKAEISLRQAIIDYFRPADERRRVALFDDMIAELEKGGAVSKKTIAKAKDCQLWLSSSEKKKRPADVEEDEDAEDGDE